MSPSLRDALFACWTIIEQQELPPAGELRVNSPRVPVPTGDVLVGIDHERSRHLLVPLADGEAVDEEASTEALILRERVLIHNSLSVRFADAHLLNGSLADLFDEVILDVLEELTSDPSLGAAVVSRVLGRWQDLMAAPETPRLLGMTALRGLFGELWFLRRIVAQDPARRVGSWCGPSRSRHDFVGGKRALEVKSTIAGDGHHVRVHGHDQLEPPEGGDLAIGFVRLERSPAGESVPDIIEGIRRGGAHLGDLWRLVTAAGVSAADVDHYRAVRFDVLESAVYPIAVDAPRVIAASFLGGTVPPGVSNLDYTVDLSLIAPLPDAAATAYLRELATGALA